MKITNEVYELVANCFMHESNEIEPMSIEDAENTINSWKEEGCTELYETEGLTPETFSEAWNELLNNKKMNRVRAILDEAVKMKNAYYFRPPTSAGARRSYERYHSHDAVEWMEGGHKYSAAFTVSCSCNNVYATGIYKKDGNKTTITAIRNSYNRMMEGRNNV